MAALDGGPTGRRPVPKLTQHDRSEAWTRRRREPVRRVLRLRADAAWSSSAGEDRAASACPGAAPSEARGG